MTTPRVLVAESLGTFYLCFAGIAAILCTTGTVGGGGGLVAVALAHGLALSIGELRAKLGVAGTGVASLPRKLSSSAPKPRAHAAI